MMVPRSHKASTLERMWLERSTVLPLDLPTREPRPQRDVSRYIGETAVQYDRVAPGVAAKEPRLTGVFADQAEQDAQRRRIVSAVGPQEAVHLATSYGEVQPVKRWPTERVSSA
jgi:hypothetical protein